MIRVFWVKCYSNVVRTAQHCGTSLNPFVFVLVLDQEADSWHIHQEPFQCLPHLTVLFLEVRTLDIYNQRSMYVFSIGTASVIKHTTHSEMRQESYTFPFEQESCAQNHQQLLVCELLHFLAASPFVPAI